MFVGTCVCEKTMQIHMTSYIDPAVPGSLVRRIRKVISIQLVTFLSSSCLDLDVSLAFFASFYFAMLVLVHGQRDRIDRK